VQKSGHPERGKADRFWNKRGQVNKRTVWIRNIVTQAKSGPRSPGRGKEKTVHFFSRRVDQLKEGVSVMRTSYYGARANWYSLWKQHPEWKQEQLAAALGYSKEWVKK
jgi:hypothetical protein